MDKVQVTDEQVDAVVTAGTRMMEAIHGYGAKSYRKAVRMADGGVMVPDGQQGEHIKACGVLFDEFVATFEAAFRPKPKRKASAKK